MTGKVKCTCGWSWNKSDSSKKDMYICHECGKDNSNNMKNGGWLDSYEDGGSMQEHQENYNDSSVSLPEGYVGVGYDTKGRNSSPAWGGQFQMGGNLRGTDLNVFDNMMGGQNNSQYETYGEDAASNLNSFNPHYTKINNVNNNNIDYSRRPVPDAQSYYESNYRESDNRYMPWNNTQEMPFAMSFQEISNTPIFRYLQENIKTNPFFKTRLEDNPYYGLNTPEGGINYYTQNDSKQLPVDEISTPPKWNIKQSNTRLKGRGGTYDNTNTTTDDINVVNQAKHKADIFNKSIQEKYGDSPNPKAQERARILRNNVEVIPNYKNGGWLDSYNEDVPQAQDGIELSEYDIAMRGMMKSKIGMGNVFGNPAIKRMSQAMPKTGMTPEGIGTHYMASMDNYAVPELQDLGEEELTLIDPDSRSREAIRFNSPEEAQYFAENYKDVAPMSTIYKGLQEYVMGGSIPGAVGFSYARTQSPAPSEGPYAKKTLPSAQDGTNVEYDYVNYGTPEYKKAYEQGKFAHATNQLDEVVVTPYDKQFPYYQQLTPSEQKYLRKNINSNDPISKQLKARATDGEGFNADKASQFAKSWLLDLPLSSLQASQSALVEGIEAVRGNEYNFLNAIEPDKQRIPSETWGVENPYAAFAVDVVADPANLVGAGLLTKEKALAKLAASKESGLLSNAYKYNPWAFKPNESNWYRQVGKSAVDDALNTKLVREAGEEVSPRMWGEFQDQIKRLQGDDAILDYSERYKQQMLAGRRPNSPYFAKGELFYPMDKKITMTKTGKVSKNPAAKGTADYLIETTLPNESFQPAYVKGMFIGVPEEIGSTAILKPNPELRNLENFNIYKKDWLQGYKEVPKQEDGGIIKDDRGQWAHPGEITEINSNQITMQGVPYPVLGISDTGDTQMMYPEEEYKFKGKKVTEYPMAKNGLRQEQKGLVNLDNLLNFTNYNKPTVGGWLDKY